MALGWRQAYTGPMRPPRPSSSWALKGFLEFVILLFAVLVMVLLLWWQVSSGQRGETLTKQVASLRDRWATVAESQVDDAATRQIWEQDKEAALDGLRPLLKLEPSLQPLITTLPALPATLETLTAYGRARSVFDRVLLVLEDIRRRQTTGFQNILFFTLALGGLAIGALVWQTQRLRWSASMEAVLVGKAQQRGRIQEHERWRLARELHDGVAQQLARAKLRFEQLDCQACSRLGNVGVRADIAGALSSSIKEIRWLCGGLRKPGESETTLDLILERSADEFRARYGLLTSVQLINDLGSHWDEAALHEISRMVQEGLTNVARHSGAGKVVLRALAVGPSLKVQVEDNGCGIRGREGFGMQGVRERVELLGGTVHWDALQPAGTRMTLTLPLPGANA